MRNLTSSLGVIQTPDLFSAMFMYPRILLATEGIPPIFASNTCFESVSSTNSKNLVIEISIWWGHDITAMAMKTHCSSRKVLEDLTNVELYCICWWSFVRLVLASRRRSSSCHTVVGFSSAVMICVECVVLVSVTFLSSAFASVLAFMAFKFRFRMAVNKLEPFV